jgi:hypothetical protein
MLARAFRRGIASAGLDESLERLAVDGAAIDALAQIGQSLEAPAFLPRVDDALHRDFTNAFDRGETEADG